MGLNILSVPINGFKSIEYAKSAIERDKENYFGYVQYGNIQFYMPSSLGGSKKEGIDFYLKAREILERDIANTKENWNYLSLLIVIGQSYYYINDYASAKAVYENILLLEPGFIYVRDELYPHLLKRMKS
jgi:tetratricopeptide (TPR) repeat protein